MNAAIAIDTVAAVEQYWDGKLPVDKTNTSFYQGDLELVFVAWLLADLRVFGGRCWWFDQVLCSVAIQVVYGVFAFSRCFFSS